MEIDKCNKTLKRLVLINMAGFVLLTLFVLLDPVPNIDRKFSEEVQEHHHPAVDTVMRAISWAGYMPNSAIVVAFATLLFLLLRFRREALFVLLTSLSGLVSTGIELTYKEMADQMNISPRTIDNYRESLFTKLQSRSRTGLVLYAIKHRIFQF